MQWLLFLAAITTVQAGETISPYWLALTVADAETSAHWYRDHLGFEVFDRMDLPERGVHIRFLKRDGFHLEIVQRRDSFAVADKVPQDFQKSQVRGYFKFGLLIRDLDAWVAKLQEAGVSFSGKVMTDARFGTRFAMIQDPDGNLIQLFEKLAK